MARIKTDAAGVILRAEVSPEVYCAAIASGRTSFKKNGSVIIIDPYIIVCSISVYRTAIARGGAVAKTNHSRVSINLKPAIRSDCSSIAAIGLTGFKHQRSAAGIVQRDCTGAVDSAAVGSRLAVIEAQF